MTPAESGLIFPDETIEQVASTLAHFVRLATIHNVPKANIMIIATEAMRRAANSAVMLGAIARSTGGLGVNILEPAVETLLGAVMGSRSGLADVKGGALFLDLGGGSVQMTYVDTESDNYEIKAARAGQSLPYGAAKLTRILQEQPDGIKAQEIERLMIGIRDVYARLCSEFPTLQKRKASYEQGGNAFVDLYMCGGGFRGYGSMLMHDDPICPYPISSISTYTVEGARFKQVARMRQLNEQENGKIFGLSKRRRRQFPAIATVVDAVVAAVPNIGYVTFCRGSNREGALLMKLPKEVRECNPLEVLADVNASLKPPIDAVLQALHTSLPHGPEFSKIPTVFNRGLGSLFVREAWKRHGYDEDTNASFVIHDAICRDSNSPGLTHLSRAILAAALSTRWGGNLGPSDAVLLKGLGGILERHHPQTAFWAKYTGAVAALVATLFPVLPSDPALSLSLRYVLTCVLADCAFLIPSQFQFVHFPQRRQKG